MLKGINSQQDLDHFKSSSTYSKFMHFIQHAADAVVGQTITGSSYKVSIYIDLIVEFMEELSRLIDEIPPIKQPMRFGNKAFRLWHQKLIASATNFTSDMFENAQRNGVAFTVKEDVFITELSKYLSMSFGNEIRIDYGTGHELNFVIFLYCLHQLNILQESDLTATILRAFSSYIKVMRRLQTIYMLEPAGSHGVWGLDDYHCLTFFFGAAQLATSTELLPSSIHNSQYLTDFASDYMYFEGIAFIKRLKSSAPFSETSPMLNDISRMSDWGRLTSGLLRLFQGEVLGKLPVVQHTLFGEIFKCEWEPSPELQNIRTMDIHTIHPHIAMR